MLRSNVLRFRRAESSHYPIRCQRARWGSLETMDDNETQQGKQIKEQGLQFFEPSGTPEATPSSGTACLTLMRTLR